MCIWSRNRKLILRRGFEGRISVIGHLVEVESANILRRGRGKREARITRDGRRKYIYIYGFFCAPIAKKKMRQFCGLFYRLFLLKRTKRGASAPEQQLFIKPTFLVQSARVRVQRGIRALLHKPAGIDILNPEIPVSLSFSFLPFSFLFFFPFYFQCLFTLN